MCAIYTTVQKFLKEIKTFIQQRHIKLIKSGRKDCYKRFLFHSVKFMWTFALNFLFIKEYWKNISGFPQKYLSSQLFSWLVD